MVFKTTINKCLNIVDIICGDLKNPNSLLLKTIIRKLDTSLGINTIYKLFKSIEFSFRKLINQ